MTAARLNSGDGDAGAGGGEGGLTGGAERRCESEESDSSPPQWPVLTA